MPNGDPDGSFGDGGKAAFDFHDLDEATAVAIDQQDRIVVVGASLPVEPGVATDVEVLRLATNGSLDGSFDHNGSVLFFLNNKHYSAAATVAIDRFGKIVIGAVVADNVHLTTFHPLIENFNATADFALARLNDDGSFDQTFGTDGVTQFVDIAGSMTCHARWRSTRLEESCWQDPRPVRRVTRTLCWFASPRPESSTRTMP